MKRESHYIACLLGLALLFTACERIEPDFFDENYNGAYFDYQHSTEFKRTLNFGEYVIGEPDTIPVTLKVKLLGYLKEEARSLSIKTKEVEGYGMANIIIPDVVFSNKEYEKDIDILVMRPEVEDSTYAINIYLDGEGEIGPGIVGKEEFTIYVKDVHEAPGFWSQFQKYLGGWNREKHAFFAYLMNDNYYYNALYDTESQSFKYNETSGLNVLSVNTLLSEEPAEAIKVNIPILGADEEADYQEPFFWGKYQEYLGWYNSKKFRDFANRINAANTSAIVEACENANEDLEKLKTEYYKWDVLTMLEEYYKYPKMGYTIDQYKDLIWIKIKKSTNYINKGVYLRIPYWWEDRDNLGTGKFIKKYYGEYSDDKYQYMIKQMIDKDGEDNFVVATILPFTIVDNGYGWDETVGGEERFIECYRLIKEKYDGRTDLSFKFPEDPEKLEESEGPENVEE